MRKLFTLIVLCSLLSLKSVNAQITAGDIAIIAMNSDNNASPLLGENFVFIALKDIPANTTITFTDNSWNATADTFRTNEGYVQWIHTADVPAGTVIVMNSSSANSWATPAPSLGTATGVAQMAFSTDGDQIIAFEGTWANRPTSGSSVKFLFAFSLENFITAAPSTSQESNLPSALAQFKVGMKNSNTETDNAYFANGTAAATAVDISGTKSELLAKFMDSTLYYQSNTLSALPTYTITLPVSLKSFSGSLINNVVGLNWATSNETNFDYFGVEKSYNTVDFVEVGRIASNKITNGSSYQFNDVSKTIAQQYYRLKMVDNDGSFKYSQVVAVNGKASTRLEVFPNPVVNTVIMSHPKASAGASIRIVGIDGRSVTVLPVQTGSTQTSIDVTRLIKSNYIATYTDKTVQSVARFAKQ
ncbi:MAG: T9SS type A sorting domain-containing protein [Chitinophagaceae bacterium]